MPSKKKSNVEILPPEEIKPTRRQVVAAKHTVVYEAPEVVDVPIEDGDETQEAEQEAEQIQQQRQPSFRTKIRDRFKARGIGVDETLTLRIDRLPFYEQNGLAGVKTEKEFCGVISCTEKFFDTDEYLIEVQRRYGPGEYWLTVRHKNAIVSSWRERVSGFPVPPVAITTEPGQPPQMIYQQAPGQATPPRSLKDELKDFSEMTKLIDGIRGPREEAPAANRTEEEILAASLLKQPAVIETVVEGLVKRFGKQNGISDEPWYADVVKDAVKSGQGAQIVKTAIDSLFNGVRGLFPTWSNNNGQAPMAQAPFQNHQPHTQNQNSQSNADIRQVQNTQTQPQGAPDMAQAGAYADPTQEQLSPEAQALNLVLDHCRRKVSPKITYNELIQREQRLDILLNQHAMQTGQLLTNQIALYLDLFADMTPDEALEVVRSLPEGESVASLPHAKEWTETLQKLIKESQEGDGDE